MVSRPSNVELEGQWEEILQRAHELVGRRVRVTVIGEAPKAEDFREAMRQWLDEAERTQPEPPAPRSPSDPFEAEFGKAMEEKFRKQGFRIP